MATIAKSIQQTNEAADERRISTPGNHEATVAGWDYCDDGGRSVVFDVRNDDGARQFVQFGLSKLELDTGELLRFLSTVLRRKYSRPECMSPQFFLHLLFNQIIGRRVVLHVIETSRAVQIVVDWKSTQQVSARTAHANNRGALSILAQINKYF